MSSGQTDRSHGQADTLRGQTDALITLNRPETAYMSCGDSASTYLGAGCTKHSVKETDGIGSHVDMLDGSTDVPSVDTDANIPANAPEIVRTPRKKPKPPDLPMEAARPSSDEPDSCRN